MILSCNSCEKKFVVPDQAITIVGRMVQCGSCGNKWKQFPIKSTIISPISNKKINTKKITNLKKPVTAKRKKAKKTREINLYSPEYLKNKHGITLNNDKSIYKDISSEKISFGFYNSLILLIVIFIAISKILYFFQDFINLNMPFVEPYINYFFESIKNIFEICKNLISSY